MNASSLELSIVNDLRELVGVAAKIDGFCEANGIGLQAAYAVNLSIDEILTNTISYGYDDDETHAIELIVRIEHTGLVVVIVDDSKAFDVSQASDADMPLDERVLGGLGLFLVHRMMDDVEYARSGGCNVITLKKNTSATV